MPKWMIPRHEQKRKRDDLRAFENKTKRYVLKRQKRLSDEERDRRNEIAALSDTVRNGCAAVSERARMKAGQCARKRKLTREKAYLVARSTSLETGRKVYGYKCGWCGWYHITTHPIIGFDYPIVADIMGGKVKWREETRG